MVAEVVEEVVEGGRGKAVRSKGGIGAVETVLRSSGDGVEVREVEEVVDGKRREEGSTEWELRRMEERLLSTPHLPPRTKDFMCMWNKFLSNQVIEEGDCEDCGGV